jgi:hypothetical protein
VKARIHYGRGIVQSGLSTISSAPRD